MKTAFFLVLELDLEKLSTRTLIQNQFEFLAK